MVAVGAIGSGDQGTGVDDQHSSVATKSVGEQFVDLMADALFTRPDSRERQVSTSGRRINVGGVVGEYFRSEFLDRDPPRKGGRFQTAHDVVGNVHVHRHLQSLRGSPAALFPVSAKDTSAHRRAIFLAHCNLRAISVPQRIRNGHHRATLVEPDNTAELVVVETAQVRKLPESISQAENAGSIPVTRSKLSRSAP